MDPMPVPTEPPYQPWTGRWVLVSLYAPLLYRGIEGSVTGLQYPFLGSEWRYKVLRVPEGTPFPARRHTLRSDAWVIYVGRDAYEVRATYLAFLPVQLELFQDE